MSVIKKVEDLVFSPRAFSQIELSRNRDFVFKMRVEIESLTDEQCVLKSADGTLYIIEGDDLQVKAYGDPYVLVTSSNIRALKVKSEART